MDRRCLCCVLLVPLVSGCQQPERQARHDAPPATEIQRERVGETYDAMIDNAMRHDMAMGDQCFVPHTARLNDLGHARLRRYVDLLGQDGGTLRYDTALSDRPMIDRRLATLERALADAGIAPDRIGMLRGLAAGPGMESGEALAARQRMLEVKADNQKDSGITGLVIGGSQ